MSLASDKQAVRASELEELAITFYVPLTAADNPAAARLCAAIETGDFEAAHQAIADDASLEFVPDLTVSPLSMAVSDCVRGDWRGIGKLLVEAGSPIDGYVQEDPPICQAISPLTSTEESMIRQLQAILSLGADIPEATAHTLLLATNSLLPYSLTARELGKREDVKQKALRIADLLLAGLRPRQTAPNPREKSS